MSTSIQQRYLNITARIHASDILTLEPNKTHVLLLPDWDAEVAAYAMGLAASAQLSIEATEHIEPGWRVMYVAVSQTRRGDLRVREISRSEAMRMAGWVEEAEA